MSAGRFTASTYVILDGVHVGTLPGYAPPSELIRQIAGYRDLVLVLRGDGFRPRSPQRYWRRRASPRIHASTKRAIDTVVLPRGAECRLVEARTAEFRRAYPNPRLVAWRGHA
jgi:hypothetical protein